MLQDKERRDVGEAGHKPSEPAAAQPESNGTMDVGEGAGTERRRLEHGNGDSQAGAAEPRAMQASSAGAGQATKGPGSRGVLEPCLCRYS